MVREEEIGHQAKQSQQKPLRLLQYQLNSMEQWKREHSSQFIIVVCKPSLRVAIADERGR